MARDVNHADLVGAFEKCDAAVESWQQSEGPMVDRQGSNIKCARQNVPPTFHTLFKGGSAGSIRKRVSKLFFGL